MRRNVAVFGLNALLVLGASGCSIASSPDNYFVVDIYQDYAGMETDATNGNYNTSKSKKIGYCYVAKDSKDAAGNPCGKLNPGAFRAYTYQEGGQTLAYDFHTPSREAPSWHEFYSFRGLEGFYSKGKPVDTTKITANCALFSTFELEQKVFPVSVQDPYGEIYLEAEEILPYGTKIVDIPSVKEALLDYPASHDYKADPLDPTTWRDPYYCNYFNDGWYLYLYDKDGKLIEGEKGADDKPITRRITASSPEATLAALSDLQIQGKMVFKPGFREEHKDYEVKVSYQKRTLDHFDINTGDAYYNYEPFVPPKNTSGKDLPTVLPAIRYGTSVFAETPEPDPGYRWYDIDGYRLTNDHKDGGVDRYDIEDPMLPSQLKESYFEDEVRKERGIMIKRGDIRYNCTITLVYEEYVERVIRFHADPSNPVKVTGELTIGDGDAVKAPVTLEGSMPSGKTFVVGKWVTTNGSKVAADLSEVHSDLDLYPLLVDTQILDPTSLLMFDFDNYYGGYLLTNVLDLGKNAITADDFHPNLFPENFPLLGVRSFGDHPDNLLSVTLPSNIKIMMQGIFTRLTMVTSIDISKVQVDELPAYSFKSLTELTKVHLPALKKLGAEQFRHCTILTTVPTPGAVDVKIDMTLKDVNAKIKSGDFAANWNNDVPVTYLPEA